MPGLGLALPTRSGLAADRLADLARQAEHAGFAGCFVAERSGDGLTVLAGLAAAPSTIELGTAIANIYHRHPAVMAMTCATINELCGGRLSVGLGSGDPVASSRQLGVAADSPMSRMREYVEVIRRVLAAPPVSYHGEVFQVEGLVPDFAPSAGFPIYIGALQRRMMALAADIADGVILNLVHRPCLGGIIAGLRGDLSDAGRSGGFRIACVVPVCVTEDRDAGLDRGRSVVANYAMHPAAARLFGQHGYAEVLGQVQERLRQGDPAGALRGVPDQMVADFVVVGDAADCRDALSGYQQAGVDLPIAFPVAHPLGWEEAISELMTVPTPVHQATQRF
jgi:alkanesulfonate monooxygenase SsuD/methylene tetrahydromethanopterin reductase-like flavin-dependent oxidoreductase (luciferase family)